MRQSAFLLGYMQKDAVIRQEGKKWILYTHDGKKRLGTHNSREEALRQERAIQARKHGG